LSLIPSRLETVTGAIDAIVAPSCDTMPQRHAATRNLPNHDGGRPDQGIDFKMLKQGVTKAAGAA
jgi:hypothetical protein